MTNDDPTDMLRFEGGPYDGGNLEGDLFGGRLPNVLCAPADDRYAYYRLDIDADGLHYRFAGWQPRNPTEADWELLRAWTDRVREESRALAAEGRMRIRQFNRTMVRPSDPRRNARHPGDDTATG